jgi:hypothetical protein
MVELQLCKAVGLVADALARLAATILTGNDSFMPQAVKEIEK